MGEPSQHLDEYGHHYGYCNACGQPSQYLDEYGHHYGYCNACGEEEELGQECCDAGEVVAYDDDLDPDDQHTEAQQ